MATSIGDLLAALDHETARRAPHDPRDAARALDRTGRLLTHLRNDGVGAETAGIRDDVVRRFADACATATVAFEGGRAGSAISLVSPATQSDVHRPTSLITTDGQPRSCSQPPHAVAPQSSPNPARIHTCPSSSALPTARAR